MLGSHPTSAQQYKSTICNGTVVTYSPIKHKDMLNSPASIGSRRHSSGKAQAQEATP